MKRIDNYTRLFFFLFDALSSEISSVNEVYIARFDHFEIFEREDCTVSRRDRSFVAIRSDGID